MDDIDFGKVNKVPRKPVVPPRLDLLDAQLPRTGCLLDEKADKKFSIEIPERMPLRGDGMALQSPVEFPSSASSPIPFFTTKSKKGVHSPLPPKDAFLIAMPPLPPNPGMADDASDSLEVGTPLAQILPEMPAVCPSIPRRAIRHDLAILQANREAESPGSCYDETPIGCRQPSLFALASITVTCAACGDTRLSRIDALEVQCGHFAHKNCLMVAQREGIPSMCVLCRQDCVYTGDSDSLSDCSSVLDQQEAHVDVDMFDDEFTSEDLDIASPLAVQRFARSADQSRHEMLICVGSQSAATIRNKSYVLTNEDMKVAHSAAMDAQGTVQFSGINARLSKMGRVRLFSRFACDGRTVTAYLFEHVIVLTELSDGFDDLMDFINLSDDDLLIYPMKTALVLKRTGDEGTTRVLKGPRHQIASWIAGIHDSKLNFPLAAPDPSTLAPAIQPVYDDTGCLDLALCLPFEHLEIVPLVLQSMGSQDRLAVIISTADNKTATLGPHKTGWLGWEKFKAMNMNTCDNFVENARNALDTAQQVYQEARYGAQKSIIFVAGCSFDYDTEHHWGTPVHTVGCGMLNIEVFRQISKRTGGQYLFAERDSDLARCVAGIAAAERTYRHHDVALYIEPAEGLTINLVVGEETVRLNETDQIEIPLGSMLAGQPKTVLVELVGPRRNPQELLKVCKLYSRHAVNELRQVTDVTGPVGLWTANKLCFHKFLQMTVEAMDMARDRLEQGDHDLCCSVLRSISAGILQYLANNDEKDALDPITDLASHKCHQLAEGIREVADNMDKNKCLPRASRAILNEAQDILRYQRAVTDRSVLERIFLAQT